MTAPFRRFSFPASSHCIRRSYLDTISALRADPDKLEEIIKMKENDRRHIPHSLRPVAAVAAALALLGISVGTSSSRPSKS